jgi:hypothetical protein
MLSAVEGATGSAYGRRAVRASKVSTMPAIEPMRPISGPRSPFG